MGRDELAHARWKSRRLDRSDFSLFAARRVKPTCYTSISTSISTSINISSVNRERHKHKHEQKKKESFPFSYS